jgi:hypothetical protein
MTDEELLDDLAAGPTDTAALTRVANALASSAKQAGTRAVATGQWLAGVLVDVAPRIPVRDLGTLRRQHGGLEGAELADELVRSASRTSAAIGATAGAAVSAGQLAPPAWILMPFELAVETVAVAVVELKLVAELHEVFERPVQGSASDRTVLLVKAWAERRGVSPRTLATPGGLADAFGRGTRNELIKVVRRRLLARLGRNLSTLAPLLAGAVAGAEVNRRATRSLGEAVVRDLAAMPSGGVTAG